MKTYIKRLLMMKGLSDLINNKEELINIAGYDCLKEELTRILHVYFATKVHNTYPKYSHMNSTYRYSIISVIDVMIINKVNKLLL